MESAAASLLESLSPFIGYLTRDALLKFFKARVALRTSVFRTPLDQLARDLIKCDPFSVKLFCPSAVEKVVEAFGKYRDRQMSWHTLLLKKGAAPSQKKKKRKETRPQQQQQQQRGSFRTRGSYRGHPGGGEFRSEPPQPYGQQPFRGRGARGVSGKGRRGGRGASSAPRQ